MYPGGRGPPPGPPGQPPLGPPGGMGVGPLGPTIGGSMGPPGQQPQLPGLLGALGQGLGVGVGMGLGPMIPPTLPPEGAAHPPMPQGAMGGIGGVGGGGGAGGGGGSGGGGSPPQQVVSPLSLTPPGLPSPDAPLFNCPRRPNLGWSLIVPLISSEHNVLIQVERADL